ncbi:unnamed protein product [Prorocentrum cordatum]|uniref:ATP-dependent transporter ycf16 n=1 Tax=Prorocentrum cordatum TaxID=2364126 RepID=A0ABN9PUR7_9DINO|nr:unnamed protein product [Polarella glacialis]
MTVSRLLVLRLRKQMFENLLVQDIALYDGIMVGQLTSRMTSDVAQLTQPISQFLTMFLSGMVQLTGATVMCIHTSWKLTLLAATMLGPVMYLTTVYATWSQGVNTLIMSAMGDCTAVATEALRNIRTVRSFGADQVERNTYNSNIDLCWKWMLKDSFASAGVTATTYCLSFATGVLIYWYGGNAILDGSDMQLNIGNLVTFNLYWQMMQTSVRQMNSMLSTLIVSASSGKRVFEIIDTSPDIPLDDPAALQLGHTLPDIVFENVKFTYQMRPDSLVFGSVSFSIPAGKTVALVGKSGAGKTTCVSLLLRFYDPQGGSILVGGHRLQELNLRAWQRRIGVVSQETQVFARSVRENLSYGLSSEEYSDASMEEAARAANIHDFILSMDQGYDSMLGEGGSRLSGGQKQRLAIARAILRGPQLLLLDEATSALDSENERQIQGAIDQMVERMQGNCSVVLIAHRLSTVINASKIIVLHEGCKLEEGTHDELLRNDKVYAKLVRKQLAKEQQELQQDKKDSDSEDEDGKGGKKGKKGKSKGSSAGTGLATEWQELRQDKKDRDNENGKMGKSKGYSAGTEVAKKEQHELQQDKTDNDSENGWKGKGKGSGAGTESTTEPQERQQEKKDSDGDGEDEKGKGGKNGKGSKKGKHKGSPPGAGKGKDEAEGGGSLW